MWKLIIVLVHISGIAANHYIRDGAIMFRIMLSVIVFSLLNTAEATTRNAATCSFSDVSTQVSASSGGDTVLVPAGDCSWSSTLNLTVGISIIGAGIGNTNITRTTVSTLISYIPSSGTFAANYALRISGFSFLLGGSGQAITLDCSCNLPAQTNIRIDHNRFYNSTSTGGGVEHTSCFGVVDNNNFDTLRSPLRAWGDSCSGYSPSTFGRWTWESFGQYDLGSATILYIEDNTITLTGSPYMVSDGDQGGSYVARYNTINTGEVYPAFDFHGGGQRGNLWGTRGGELYGNAITGSGFLISQRGGRNSAHHNTFSGGGDVNLYDNDGCPLEGVAPYNTYQAINGSYHFLNRNTVAGTLLGWGSSGGDDCSMVIENSTFWMDNTSCEAPNTCGTISIGIGCGTLANRPGACTVGTGYWATDQSCTSLSGLVGSNPATPINGTLYKCTSTNNWTAHYTPYTYPHPLRNEASSVSSIAGGGVRIGGGAKAQ